MKLRPNNSTGVNVPVLNKSVENLFQAASTIVEQSVIDIDEEGKAFVRWLNSKKPEKLFTNVLRNPRC